MTDLTRRDLLTTTALALLLPVDGARGVTIKGDFAVCARREQCSGGC